MAEKNIEAIMRDQSFTFLNITPKATAPTWALINKGIEELSISYNAKTSEKHFIGDSNATTLTTGYNKQVSVTQVAYKGDPIFDFVDELFFKDAKGFDTETQLLEVFPYRTGSPYDSKLSSVSIGLDTFGGSGGEELQVSYNINLNGCAVLGKTVITGGKPVFTEIVQK